MLNLKSTIDIIHYTVPILKKQKGILKEKAFLVRFLPCPAYNPHDQSVKLPRHLLDPKRRWEVLNFQPFYRESSIRGILNAIASRSVH